MLLALKSNIERIIGGLAILVLSGLLINQALEARHWHKQSDRYEKLYGSEKSAHQQTEVNYRRAAEAARVADAANAKRVLQEQAAINKERSDVLEARLADARARYERLRNGATASNSSGAGKSPVSSVPNATRGTDEATLEDQLLATEQAIQLDELIRWVWKQAGVKVSQ